MPRENFNDLLAFVTVAREGSFTRIAAKFVKAPLPQTTTDHL
jgi:DNA-binding transcriptional LysR family regulator